MAELQIDDDWKRQAQEEKRKLAEADAQRKAATTPAPPVAVPGATTAVAASKGRPGQRELPEPSFHYLVQNLVTQALIYLGELATPGREPIVNYDMAKLNIDLLAVIEDKTKGNLTAEETHTLDQMLYEVRMRFISATSNYIASAGGGPG